MSVDTQTYLSWSITNTGSDSVDSIFFTDLYFDGMLLERWTHGRLHAGYFSFITDWTDLQTFVRLTPGRHTLRLEVDPTDLVRETDETDNVFEWSYVWDPPEQPAATELAGDRLPDIVPFTPEGWDAPLIATSYSGDTASGPLSVSVPTQIRFSVRNQGLSSTPADVWVHLFLDDVVVGEWFLEGFLADEWINFREWSGLLDTINLAPGVHTLKVVADATDLVEESDESNNVFAREFTWLSGPVEPKLVAAPTPAPTAPAPLTRPNLVPGWWFGWDGPIIVSTDLTGFNDTPMSVGLPAYVDVVVRNESTVRAPVSFDVDLYFDNELVQGFTFPGHTRAGSVRWWDDWDMTAAIGPIAEGPHTLKMVVDPFNVINEANESDNTYEKTIVWTSGPVEDSGSVVYEAMDLWKMVIDLQNVLDTQAPALGPDGTDNTEKVMRIAEAGYYLLTGKSLTSERVDIALLTRDDFLSWIDSGYAEDFAVSSASDYPVLLSRRERIKSEATGFKTRRFGKVTVVIDAENDVASVIDSLAHELGHMRQDFLNPNQSETGGSHALLSLQEAQAQQFQKAFWQALAEFNSPEIMAYPEFVGYKDLIDRRFDAWLSSLGEDEHSLGYMLQWLAVLDDPELGALKEELISTGRLRAESSLALYNYFVRLDPVAVQAYVSERFNELESYIETILEISKSRLISDPDSDLEGSPVLRVVGLTMP